MFLLKQEDRTQIDTSAPENGAYIGVLKAEDQTVVRKILIEGLYKGAEVLKIPVEAFQNFDEEQAVNVIANTFGEYAFNNSFNYGTINFHPIEKIIELHEEKISLYERMLKEKDEMMARLEKLIS
ncbi:XRE family transcriptional regulator [Chryseobacterium fluminis]|uniref:XRE family transcriptional regulator n=1 Tax=Chryseobacterium fluminis TaxID=2983606 RepID=UPI0038CC07FF